VRDLFEILEELGQRDLFEFATFDDAVALVAFVAQVTSRFHVARRFAQKRNCKALAHRFVIDAQRRWIQDFDAVGGIVRIEDRNREIIAIHDLDRTDDERIFRRKEFMAALVPRGNLVKYTMMHESAQNLPQGGDRGKCFRAVSARVDDLQAVGFRSLQKLGRKVGGEALHESLEEPFAFAG
jgi:hypothetical protein